jgi:hypothetical protein
MQSLKKVIDESKARGDFSGGSLSYFGWKDKDVKVLRFLTDDVITANFHEFISTNDGKAKSFLVDPAKGDFVAKYASPTPGLGWKMDYKTKQPIERKPRELTVGLAVLRDLEPRDGGGFNVVDVFEEVDFKNEKFQSRTFGLVTQSHGNFWKSLIGYFNLYNTICDRDYRIERSGADKNTEYTITPLDPVEEFRDPAVLHAFYGYGKPWNDEDPERFLFCPQTLSEWADYYSGEERAKHWLLPSDGQAVISAPAAVVSTFASSAPDEAQAAPAPSGSTDFAGLREKLLGHKK